MKRIGAWSLIALALAGCPAHERPPLPPVGPLADAEVLAELSRRTQALETCAAEVAVSYDGPERRGTLDALVLYRQGELRFLAWKDLLFADRPVFDVLFGREEYASELDLGDGAPPTIARGPLAQFPGRVPRFAGFYWAGPALFLGGAVFDLADARVVERRDGEVLVEAGLPSGARVSWRLAQETLAPLAGRLTAPDERVYQLHYTDVAAPPGGLPLPRAVVFEDVDQEVRIELSLKGEPDFAPEFGPDAFALEDVGKQPW